MSCEKDVLKNFAKFTENTCARVSFLIKFQASGNFIKRKALVQVLPMNFAKYLRTLFL